MLIDTFELDIQQKQEYHLRSIKISPRREVSSEVLYSIERSNRYQHNPNI
jgi:hypothetical protein